MKYYTLIKKKKHVYIKSTLMDKKIKFRNGLLHDSKQLSDIENEVFYLDKVNTNFEIELEKENKKIFVCTYENIVKKETVFFKRKFDFLKFNLKNQNIYSQEEVIIGYIKIWKIMEDLHIEQLGVLKNFQQQGIGEKLLKLSIKYCIQNGLNKILLECRQSNQAAINLYKKYLFNITSIRKNYYPLSNKREDAVCFESPDLKNNDFFKNLK